MILFFQSPDLLVDSEWLSTAVALAVSFFIFFMGVLAFVIQTLIAGNLRDIYYERQLEKGGWQFIIYIFLIFV